MNFIHLEQEARDAWKKDSVKKLLRRTCDYYTE